MTSINHKKYILAGIFIAILNIAVLFILPITITVIAALFDPIAMSGFGPIVIPYYLAIAAVVWPGIIALYLLVVKLMKSANIHHAMRVFIVSQLLYFCVIVLPGLVSTNERTIVEMDAGAIILLVFAALYNFAVPILSLYVGNALVNRDQKRY